eukprot:1147082-Pelagomonas_calceolata.AAC.1
MEVGPHAHWVKVLFINLRVRMHYQKLCQCALVEVQQDGRLLLPKGLCEQNGCHGEEIEISSSSCLMLGVGGYAVVRQDLEVAQGTCIALAQYWGSGSAGSCRRSLSSEELEHDLFSMRRMAEEVATIAYRKSLRKRWQYMPQRPDLGSLC